jgi:transposase
MKAYSLDLRERVLTALLEGDTTQAEVAAQFQISDATVELWWRRWRETQQVAPKPWAAGGKRTLQTCAAAIRAAVTQQPDATLQELCTTVAAQTGVHASPSMMCRELQRLDLPRKKVVAR